MAVERTLSIIKPDAVAKNVIGEIVARLPQFEAAVLRAEFAVMSGRTPYVYFGDWPVLAAVLLMLLAILGRLRRAVSETG